MSEHDDNEKTESPSAKRLREAREKGDVPRSRDLNAAAVTLAAVATLLIARHAIGDRIASIMRAGLTHKRAEFFDPHTMALAFGGAATQALASLAPVLAVTVAAALAAPMMLGGWTFSLQALGFKAERLDPLAGFGRVFSVRGLVELVKSVAKILVIGTATYQLLHAFGPSLLETGVATAPQGIARALDLVGWAALGLAGSLVAISLIDVPWQLHSYAKKLRMTREELRDEYKESEGRPEVKQKVRQLQMQMARKRMMQEVPKADVVVTNPTHFAVALKYEEGKNRAPVVVAKGADHMALQIRAIAAKNNVPLLSAPPLARALYRMTEVGQEVPSALYVAVAQVLAWVFRLKRAAETGEYAPEPPKPEVDRSLSDPPGRA